MYIKEPIQLNSTKIPNFHNQQHKYNNRNYALKVIY